VSKSSVTVAAREQALVDRARAETGLDDLGVDTWREGLEVLLQSAITEAHLNELGEHMFYDSIVRALTNRLQIEDWYGRHPEIEEQQVEVELLGVGFPRTGSTALAALLPVSPPRTTALASPPRRRSSARSIRWQRGCGRCSRSRRAAPSRTTT
jgi:hypothetical protein